MPGILPMKVIKVGTSSQSRIAQACDRCRSKKIRCDGIRPTCTQCANVGFECKTSDKLSRRAFPRGYTESLEERVRQLEAEVHELKDLLDEKDEKIDMLSKMHANRRPSSATGPVSPSSDGKREAAAAAAPPPKEDTFRVQASPLLLGVENSDSYFMGASSGRSFIESFKRRLQEKGKPCSEFNPEAFLHIQGCQVLTAKSPPSNVRTPPRLFSDRSVNLYFQEWAPLFPVLHKPTFLSLYEEYVADPEKTKNSHKLAQLFLVFSLASLSSDQPDLEQVVACELQWQRSLEAVLMENTMLTLQCLVLALMYCMVRADYKRLQHYKAIAVGLSHRLGLHQSQKRFSFGALTIETRKKVFWTLYTLDCFSAAILGLPKLLKDEDIHAEFPADTDDEFVTEKGFQAARPGEHTRISSALALFSATRLLGKVLEKNYPASTSHELSLQQMSALEAELDEWSENLPQHLKLNFKQDKPSTDVTGSRSPLLALAYYYIRTLIFRPAVGSTLGSKDAPALISVSDSSKHIIQIISLLEERNMSFSFCLNKADVLILCGIALLYQSMDLKEESKMMKDNGRLVNSLIKVIEKAKSPGWYDFKRAAGLLVHVDEPKPSSRPTPSRKSSTTSMAAPPSRISPSVSASTAQKKPQSLGRHAAASISETDLLLQQEKLRRMTMPQVQQSRPGLYRSSSRASFDSGRQERLAYFRDHQISTTASQAQAKACQAAMIARVSPTTPATILKQNLDYLSLSPTDSHPTSPIHSRGPSQPKPQPAQTQVYHTPTSLPGTGAKVTGLSSAEWEALLGSLDGGQINVYDAIYGGPALSLNETSVSLPATAAPTYSSWSPDSWDLSGFSLSEFGAGGGITSQSLSDETLSSTESGEELAASSDLGLSVSSLDYGTGILPVTAAGMTPVTSDGFLLESLDATFPLMGEGGLA